jgi:phage terminase large subunit-like protein
MVCAAEPRIDKAKAQHAVDFIQSLKHTKGQWAGQPFILLPWQEKIIRDIFGTVKGNGCRQYNTAYIEIPKKNGKSELAAAVALYLLFADDEPGAEIYSAAADRDQAAIVFNVAAEMVRMSPALMKRCRILDSVRRIVVYKTASFYRVLSADVKNKHGFNVHGVIFDELHAQPNRELYDVLTEGTGDARRQPLWFIITTAGIDRNSICWEVHEKARQILNGTREDPSFYPVIYGLDDEENWEDEGNWYRVNPSLGTVIDIEKVQAAFNEAKQNVARENNFRRLRLNQWVKQSMRWMKLDKWDASAGIVDPDKLRGRNCYAGLDLSSTIDLTAFGMVFPDDDGTYDVLMHFWIPEDTMIEKEKRDRVPYSRWVREGYVTATPGDVIDYKFVQSDIEEYAETYDIREIAFDRWGATKIQQDLTDAGFTMVQFGQGFASMSPPTKELMTLVLGLKLRHGGNPVLRWNIDNLVVRQDPAGNLKPDKEKSTQKIDGAVALIMALDRATRHADTGSVYDDRGIEVI